MNNSTKGNMYTSGQAEVRALFGSFIQGSPYDLLCAVSFNTLDSAAQEALNSTAAALGYGTQAFTFVCLDDEGIELDPISLFTVIEGLDPLVVVLADDTARQMAETAYRSALPIDAECRLSGRPAVAFRDFSGMLGTASDKQKAWALLKTLPKR